MMETQEKFQLNLRICALKLKWFFALHGWSLEDHIDTDLYPDFSLRWHPEKVIQEKIWIFLGLLIPGDRLQLQISS